MNGLNVPLNFLNEGRFGRVESISSGELIIKKLMEMGIVKGSTIQVMKNDMGPMILRIGETRLVLGKGMAQKVIVREC
ncbi:FeoA family protein [Clostridium rectalis]|uniref:FeoA family protein n=1 Tax=Clostridium rectalis TaxID=2040295 RepID=UPI000F62F371|nr:FeoA family protein [Clostridium rectalis]